MSVPVADSAAVAVLVVVLIVVLIVILVLIVVLVVVLILILVLLVHSFIPPNFFLRSFREPSFPRNSGFILSFENQADDQTGDDGCSDAAGRCFQPAGEDAKKTVLLHSFLYALGKVIPKAGKRHSGACSCKFCQRLIKADSAQQYADDYIAD